MKILNFGSCNIDFVYNLEHIVREGETISAEKMKKFSGGKGLNQSVALAKGGAEVYHAGKIGADGEFLREILKGAGVNTDFLETVNEPTGHAIIQVSKSGQNSIIISDGANGCVDKAFIDGVLCNFSKDDILVLQNEISNVNYIVEKADSIGMKIVLNPSPYNQKIKDIDFNKLWLIIINEVEGKDITGKASPELIIKALREKYNELKIVLTLGSKGAMFSGERECFCPAFEVKAVDTTGAGDTFTGFLISALSKGEDIEFALKKAACASALAITKSGAANSIPSQSEVIAALESLKIKD
jgi:ribokinase